MKKPLPTDLDILDAIYERYYNQFAASTGQNKIYVPIDIPKIADDLKVDPDIVFGRLYYHLDPKYRFAQRGGALVFLFAKNDIPNVRDAIHFPYMASVLADLRAKNREFWIATGIAFGSLALSLIAIGISIYFRSPGG